VAESFGDFDGFSFPRCSVCDNFCGVGFGDSISCAVRYCRRHLPVPFRCCSVDGISDFIRHSSGMALSIDSRFALALTSHSSSFDWSLVPWC